MPRRCSRHAVEFVVFSRFSRKERQCVRRSTPWRAASRGGRARRCFAAVTTYRDQTPYSRTLLRPGVPTIIWRKQGCGVLLAHKQTGQAKIFGCTGTEVRKKMGIYYFRYQAFVSSAKALYTERQMVLYSGSVSRVVSARPLLIRIVLEGGFR